MRAVVFCPADLEPRSSATAGLRRDALRVAAATTTAAASTSSSSFELDWGFVNVNLRSYYAEGSKTLAFEIAEQLGWERPTRSSPDRVRRAVHEGAPGLRQLPSARAVDGAAPRCTAARPRAARPSRTRSPRSGRVSPVRPTRRASLAIGNPADGDLASRPRAVRRRDLRRARGTIGANIALLARDDGVFGETAAGVTLGALREAVRRGELGAGDRVVLLVTGDGLKTPQPSRRRARIEIDADADALLAALSIADA
jgi:threonine synthase